MRVARLDLLRQRVHVAEPALERRALEDRRHTRRLVNIIRRFDRGFDCLRAAQPDPNAGRGIDRGDVVGGFPDVLQNFRQLGAARTKRRLTVRDIGLHDRHVGHPDQAARGFGFRQRDEFVEHGARDAHRDAGDADRVKSLAW